MKINKVKIWYCRIGWSSRPLRLETRAPPIILNVILKKLSVFSCGAAHLFIAYHKVRSVATRCSYIIELLQLQ